MFFRLKRFVVFLKKKGKISPFNVLLITSSYRCEHNFSFLQNSFLKEKQNLPQNVFRNIFFRNTHIYYPCNSLISTYYTAEIISLIITRNLFFYNSLVQEKIGPDQNNVCGFLDIFIERFSIECHKTKI